MTEHHNCMNTAQLNDLTIWFDSYVEPFLATDAEGIKNIQLKILHTKKVCAAMAMLATSEKLSENESLIASTVALLHDLGRFEQYRRWRTFLDGESDNHARMAIDLIRDKHILDSFDPAEQLLISEAVRFHNMLAPPVKILSSTRLFINLIRDADKLDIWRVFVELLAQPLEERASAATLGMPDAPDMVSDLCIAALNSGSIVPLNTITCFNDFKLLQISWIYDLNFATSRRILAERGYIQTLAATLPKRADIQEAVAKALASLSGCAVNSA